MKRGKLAPEARTSEALSASASTMMRFVNSFNCSALILTLTGDGVGGLSVGAGRATSGKPFTFFTGAAEATFSATFLVSPVGTEAWRNRCPAIAHSKSSRNCRAD